MGINIFTCLWSSNAVSFTSKNFLHLAYFHSNAISTMKSQTGTEGTNVQRWSIHHSIAAPEHYNIQRRTCVFEGDGLEMAGKVVNQHFSCLHVTTCPYVCPSLSNLLTHFH